MFVGRCITEPLGSDALPSSCPRFGVLCVCAGITKKELEKWIAAAGLVIDLRVFGRFTQKETAEYFQDCPASVFSDASRGRAWLEAKVTHETVRFG